MVSSQQDQLIWPSIVGKCTIKEATRYLYEIKDTTTGPSDWNWIGKFHVYTKFKFSCRNVAIINSLPNPF